MTQDFIVYLIVVGAVFYLARTYWSAGKGKSGCGGCGKCPTSDQNRAQSTADARQSTVGTTRPNELIQIQLNGSPRYFQVPQSTAGRPSSDE